MTAFKPGEEGRSAVLRVYNPGGETVTTEVPACFARATQVRMDETPMESISKIRVAPNQIVTLKVDAPTYPDPQKRG